MKLYQYISFILILTGSLSFGQIDSLNKANSLYKGMQYENAERIYLQTIKDSSTRIKSLYNIGNTYYQLKKYDEAVKNYQACLKDLNKSKEIDITHLHHNIGNSYLKQKMFDKAIESYKKALRINPNDEDTRYNLQYALDQKKKNDNKDDKKNEPKEDKKDPPKQDQEQPKPKDPEKKSQEDRTREQMKRILDRLNKKEQKVKRKAEGKKSSKNANNENEKDW